jgi:hypothetical protein
MNNASTNPTSRFLRRVMWADAVISGATGVFLWAGAEAVARWLGVPAVLLRYSGFSLLPFAALVAYAATRPVIPRAAVWAIIVLNALWAIDSIVLLFTGWVTPTGLGYAFIAGQAVIVAAFAEFQYIGLRRSVARFA